MIEVIFDMEIVSDAIYRYVHLTEKWGAEVLERHNSIHHNLWHFHLSFEHSMAASWQECHCDSSSHLSLWIKQNPSKLSNLMVLDNNIITTYSGRKALLFLQRGGHLKKPCIHLDSSESTKWNCSASLWNPCILNVHKVIIFTLSYHTSASPGFTCFWHQGIEEAKGSKNMTYKVQKMGRTWLQIFLVYSILWSYAELPLTWKVVLCVAQKGKLLPNGYCDIQLWILQLLSVLKFTRISHFHQADLYLHLVVTILASFLPFLEVGITWRIFLDESWQHIENLDKVHITPDCVCICLGRKWEHSCTAWEHMQLKSSAVLRKVMLQNKHCH